VKRLWILGDCIVEADKKVLDKLTQMSRMGESLIENSGEGLGRHFGMGEGAGAHDPPYSSLP